jgi:hypothetical protein
MTGTIVVQ